MFYRLTLMVALAFHSAIGLADTLSRDEVLAQLKSHEQTRMSKSVEYRFEYRYAITKTNFDVSTAGGWDKRGISGKVLLGEDRVRFLASFKRLQTYITPSQKQTLLGAYEEYSQDGDIFKTWKKSVGGDNASPPERDADLVGYGVVAPASQEAQYVQQEGFYKNSAEYTGVAGIPPYIALMNDIPRPLSDILDKSQDQWSVSEKDGNWQFVVPWIVRDAVKGNEMPVEIQVLYSPVREVMVEMDYRKPGGDSSTRILLEKLTVSEVGGNWWPQAMDRFQSNSWRQTNYSEYDIQDGDNGKERFALEFPDGIRVDDHIEERKYEVGKSVSDQEAVRRYKQQMGVLLEPPPPQSVWSRFKKVTLVGLVMAIVAFGVWRMKRNLACLLFFCWVASSPILADDVKKESFRLSKQGDWTVHPDSGPDTSTVQCGTRVTLFALECGGVKYSLPAVTASLRPEPDGIRLLHIREVLRSYGMQATARKGVSARDLVNSLSNSRLAIFPVVVKIDIENKSVDWRHYLVAMLNSDGQPMIYDVPRSVKPIEIPLLENMLKLTEGMVLFVEKSNAGTTPLRAQCPPSLDFGEFEISGVGEYEQFKKDIVISVAPEGTPLVIEDVQASCGCTVAEVKDRLILPGESGRIQVSIRAHGWGIGDQSKMVRLLTSHGGEPYSVSIRGKGIPGVHSLPQVSVGPATHRITYEMLEEGHVNLMTTLTGNPNDLSDLILRGSTGWIQGSVVVAKSAPNHGDLTIRVHPDPDCLSQLKLGQGRTERLELRLKSRIERDPQIVEIVMMGRKAVRCEPPLVVVDRGGGATNVSLKAADGKLWVLAKGQELPNGIRAVETSDPHTLSISADADAASKLTSLDLRLQSGEDVFMTRLLVKVKSK